VTTTTVPRASGLPVAPEAGQPARYYRIPEGRVLSGVARGLSVHLGLDVGLVRLAFVLLTVVAAGAGLVIYAALWIFAPLRLDGPPAAPGDALRSRRRELPYLLGLCGIGLAVTIALHILDALIPLDALVPLAVAGAGLVLLWRQGDDAQRARWRAATRGGRWRGIPRAVIGVALVIGGGIAFALSSAGELTGTGAGLLVGAVVVVGLMLVTAPWWLQLVRELGAERSARIREQERAEIAAHVHDSVLHTLTLIQRNVDDPREVARLARSQERELRSWLYRPAADPATTVSAALEAAAAEVEDDHGVTVEVVVVGEAPLEEPLRVLLQAAREALVNAAKYAGDSPISLYAEVEPGQLSVFVRDRGQGFDLDAVPEDRLGVRQSIIGRMARHGGVATVRTSPGDGTEVQLEMPRHAKGAQS
jgi:signal transduction histidine kinase/phage shock protein PspC (stress-responsive transcriptional regulator)